MVDAMLEIDKEVYKKYVIHENNGKKPMYVRLSKAMYETFKAEFIYYRKLLKELREYGFVINSYDPCAEKKLTGRGQLTVAWHVNDMKVSHKNREEVKEFIEYMKGIYGEEIPVTRVKKHTYVGMDLNYSTLEEVIVSMESYITKAIDKFPEEVMK